MRISDWSSDVCSSDLHPASAGDLSLGEETLARGIAGRTRGQLRRIQLVFQSADTALNSQQTVGRILGRVLDFFGLADRSERSRRVAGLLKRVNLPEHFADSRRSEERRVGKAWGSTGRYRGGR